jgi:hypothetical protein
VSGGKKKKKTQQAAKIVRLGIAHAAHSKQPTHNNAQQNIDRHGQTSIGAQQMQRVDGCLAHKSKAKRRPKRARALLRFALFGFRLLE